MSKEKKIEIPDTERDKEIEARLVSMMTENPAGLIIYFLAICGRSIYRENNLSVVRELPMMEEPAMYESWIQLTDSQRNCANKEWAISCNSYKKHIADLKEYPASWVTKEMDGKDVECRLQWQRYNGHWTNDEWIDCTEADYNDSLPHGRRIIAFPVEEEKEWVICKYQLPQVEGHYNTKRAYGLGEEISFFDGTEFNNYHGYRVVEWQRGLVAAPVEANVSEVEKLKIENEMLKQCLNHMAGQVNNFIDGNEKVREQVNTLFSTHPNYKPFLAETTAPVEQGKKILKTFTRVLEETPQPVQEWVNEQMDQRVQPPVNVETLIVDVFTKRVWLRSECDESMLVAFPKRYIECTMSPAALASGGQGAVKDDEGHDSTY